MHRVSDHKHAFHEPSHIDVDVLEGRDWAADIKILDGFAKFHALEVNDPSIYHNLGR